MCVYQKTNVFDFQRKTGMLWTDHDIHHDKYAKSNIAEAALKNNFTILVYIMYLLLIYNAIVF